jgi:hypothetical protein
MSAVARPTARGVLPDPSPAMLDLLARVRAGAVLVTAEKLCRSNTRLVCELDGETIKAGAVKGLIKRRLLRVVSRTARTKTWAAEGV